MAARPQEPPSPRLGPDPIPIIVFGDTAYNCTRTRAQREKKPGLAVPAEVEQLFHQKLWDNAQYYVYYSGGFLPSWFAGDAAIEPLPVVNPNRLHARWKMAETILLHEMGVSSHAGVLQDPDSSSWPPLKMFDTLINFATQLQLLADVEAETEPLSGADVEAIAVHLLCADAEAEPRRSERIKRRREDEDTPLRQQQGKRMRADDVQDEEDEDDEEDASEADVPEPKAAEVEERDFEETAAAPPSSEQPPKKRDQSGKSCDWCVSRKARCQQFPPGADGQLFRNEESAGPPCAECISRGQPCYWTPRKKPGQPREEPELAMGVIGQAPTRRVAGRTKPRQTAAKGKGKGPAQPVASAKPDAGPSRPRQGKVKGKAGQPSPKDHGHLKGDKA